VSYSKRKGIEAKNGQKVYTQECSFLDRPRRIDLFASERRIVSFRYFAPAFCGFLFVVEDTVTDSNLIVRASSKADRS